MTQREFDSSINLSSNAMLRVSPELFDEWNFEKNDEMGLDVYKITKGSHTIAWWTGKECGHPWDATIYNRVGVNKTGCPVCSNKRVLIGFNDIWTTDPNLASLLADPEDGYRYTQSSDKRVSWRCLECTCSIKNKKISDIRSKGLSCPMCSDGVKFPEKFMYNLLREAEINFEYDLTQKWSEGKRYDFHLVTEEGSCIIEVHGEQHYTRAFQYSKSKTLEEEQKNDALKEKLAKENGIENYIVIDARESSIEWMRNSILDSDIMRIVGDVDFEKIGQLSSKTFIKEICDLWSSGLRDASKIAGEMELGYKLVLRCLKRGAEIGWCDYSVDEVNRTRAKNQWKPVIQISLEGGVIREWESIKEAAQSLSLSESGISSACKGRTRTSGGFRWSFKDI